MSQYDPTVSTERDKVRFLIGDTDNDNLMLSDDEVGFALTEKSDDIYLASATLCKSIAARFARDVNYRFSTLWQDAGDAYAHYMDLAKQYEDAALIGGGSMEVVFTMSGSRCQDNPEEFWYGMHDNPQTLKTDEADC